MAELVLKIRLIQTLNYKANQPHWSETNEQANHSRNYEHPRRRVVIASRIAIASVYFANLTVLLNTRLRSTTILASDRGHEPETATAPETSSS